MGIARCCVVIALLASSLGPANADRLRLRSPITVHSGPNATANHSKAQRTGNSSQPRSLSATRSVRQSSNTSQPGMARPPRVYFLFMAVDKVSNLGVWQQFFAQAPVTQYRALIHCKLPSCHAQVAGSVLSAVPTVPSYYCTDLVSPMNQLLSHALTIDAADGLPHPNDKFAFVSDSTLPAKPFSFLYQTLAMRPGSDFCIFPSNEWADIPSAVGLEMAPKHHQWITLERAHAEKASALWAGGQMHNFMSYFRMNQDQYIWSNNTYADNRNFGCLDEFWHLAALYGTITVNPHTESMMDLYGFSGSPLRVSDHTGWQGTCDTFVVWSKYLHAEGDNPFERLHRSLDAPSIPHGGNSARPGWWDTISPTGMRAIRNSDFLFVRKFIDNPAVSGSTGDFATNYVQLVVM